MEVHSNRYLGFPEAESVKCESFSLVLLFATPGTVAHQAPLSMGFLRQEYWSGLPFPSLGYSSNPGIESTLAGGFFTTVPPVKPPFFSFSFYPVIILFYLLD